ncbi:MAG: GAF domain-containing SpoIIE family protein phosphatase [Planctomycetota bacterium]
MPGNGEPAARSTSAADSDGASAGLDGVVDGTLDAAHLEPVRADSLIPFLTDGWLPHLCESLGSLTGRPVTLHDASGAVVVATPGDPPFSILPRTEDDESDQVDRVEAAIRVGGRTLGWIRATGVGEADRPALRTSIEQLAAGSAEVIGHSLELRHRVLEMSAMYRLTSLLARATEVEQILRIALESALEVLELDAGSIVLFDDDNDPADDERGVRLMTSQSLSEAWLADPRPLSVAREFDRRASAGETIVVEDLRLDPRIIGPERVRDEGLVGFVTCAMLIQGRAIGAIRLYDREPRLLDDAEQRLVRSIAQQVGLALEQSRLLELQAEDRKMQRQLHLAGDVQRRMLPAAMPSVPPFDIAARYVPSFDLGGDFYDAFKIGERSEPNIGLAVGDVVGKGVAAALLMSSVRSSLRAYAHQIYDLDEIVSKTNRALARDTTEAEFVTLWYGVADPKTRHLTYCGAGHEPPLIVRVPDHRAPTTADVDELVTGGMVLGIDPSQRYQRGHFDLKPGDVLVAYTDGITDTRDFEDHRFGKRRLIDALLEILSENPQAEAATVVERVFWHLRQFAGLSVRQDDQTLLVMRTLG